MTQADYLMTPGPHFDNNTLSFAIGVAQTPDGFVGRIYHGGVEVWETPSPFSDREQAHRHAVRHLSRRLSIALQS